MPSAPRPRRVALTTILAAVLAALMIPSAAPAATQTVADPSGDSGLQNDLREAGWDHDGTNVTFRFAVPHSTWTGGYNDRVIGFVDTNADGRSDFAVHAFSGSTTSMTLYSTPQSTATCQKAGTGAVSLRTGSVAVVQDGALARVSWTFPASDIGGVSAFRWAVYGMSFSVFNNAFDYLPDAANTDPSRPNPVTTVNDKCTDGSGGSHALDLPLVMANGLEFPNGSTAGTGGTGDGGGDGGGGGATTPTGDVHTVRGTSFVGSMPKLTGMRVDAARRALEAAGFAFTSVKTRWVKKGKADAGDVVAQSPAAGAAVQGALRAPALITLGVKAARKQTGARRCDSKAFLGDLKNAELPLASTLLRQGGCKTRLNFSLGTNEDMLARVQNATRKAITMKVTCPRTTEEQDLFAFFREWHTGLSFGAGDWALTVSDATRNYVSMSVLQRGAYVRDGRIGGQFVQNAKVYVDGSDVGAQDIVGERTDENGNLLFTLKARKAGKVDICIAAEDADGKTIYGSAQLRAVSRSSNQLVTVSGRELTRVKGGGWSETTVPESQYVRTSADFFGPLVSAIQQLLTGFTGKVPAVFNAQAPAQDRLRTASRKLGFSPGQFAFGQAVGATSNVVRTQPVTGLVGQAGSNLISDKGMGAIAVGGGNAIAAGGGNLVGQAGTNAIPTGGGSLAGAVNVAKARIVEFDGHQLISDNGLGVIAAGGANAICAGGYN